MQDVELAATHQARAVPRTDSLVVAVSNLVVYAAVPVAVGKRVFRKGLARLAHVRHNAVLDAFLIIRAVRERHLYVSRNVRIVRRLLRTYVWPCALATERRQSLVDRLSANVVVRVVPPRAWHSRLECLEMPVLSVLLTFVHDEHGAD